MISVVSLILGISFWIVGWRLHDHGQENVSDFCVIVGFTLGVLSMLMLMQTK